MQLFLHVEVNHVRSNYYEGSRIYRADHDPFHNHNRDTRKDLLGACSTTLTEGRTYAGMNAV